MCGNCDERHLETHVAFEGGLTRRLARQLVTDAKDMSIRAVVRHHGLDWHLIQALVTSWAVTVAEHRRSRVLWWTRPPMRKRHRAPRRRHRPDPGHGGLLQRGGTVGVFIKQGPKWCRGVKVAVCDGSKSYRSAIEAHLGGACHVLDRFHVVRWFTDALTLVRRDLQRREPTGIKPAFDPELFRARFLLLKRADTLNDDEQARLDRLFDTHPSESPRVLRRL